jgi:hypothetical protein
VDLCGRPIGGENGRAVDAAIPECDALLGEGLWDWVRLQHTMKVLHVVAVVCTPGLMRLGKHSSEKGRHSARLCE